MKFRLPLFIQIFLLVTTVSVSAIVITILSFVNYTREILEDEVFEKYLLDSASIQKNLQPVLDTYEEKIRSCFRHQKCDPDYAISQAQARYTFLSEKVAMNPLDGTTYLIFGQKSKIFVSLNPLFDAILDAAVIRDEYIFILNKEMRVVANAGSPFKNNSILTLPQDVQKKIQIGMTNSSFFLPGPRSIQTMNVYYQLPQLDLVLVYGSQQKKAFYDITRIEEFATKIILSAIGFIVFISFAFSRIQKRRFVLLIKSIRKLSEGDYGTRILEKDIRDFDEVDEMYRAFNSMAQELEYFHQMNISKIVEMNEKLSTANQKLEEAKNWAESASKAKTAFLASMSHEIRSPLNAIIGFIQIIFQDEKKQQIPDKILEYLQSISASSKNLSEIINNILDLSKIEAGKMEVYSEEINLLLLVQGIYHIHKGNAFQKKIEFRYAFSPQLPEEIIIDRTKLNQIIMNLVSNALKFTPSGQSVTIKLDRLIEQQELLLVEVVDTGIGIPPEKQKTIFEAFAQTDESITSKFGGTGLGLNIVYKIVELLGGKIELTSNPGQGSSFKVYLPLKYNQKKQLVSEQQQENNSRYSGKVLVVEDDESARTIFNLHMEKFEIEPILAKNGQEAIDKYRETRPDVIFMDMHLPEMNGVEVAKKIYAISPPDKVKIIGMSADVFSGYKDKVMEMGFVEFINKPIDFSKVEKILQEYLPTEILQIEENHTNTQELSPHLKNQIEKQLSALQKTPLFCTDVLLAKIQAMKNDIGGYPCHYLELLNQLEEAIYSRKSENIVTILQEAGIE